MNLSQKLRKELIRLSTREVTFGKEREQWNGRVLGNIIIIIFVDALDVELTEKIRNFAKQNFQWISISERKTNLRNNYLLIPYFPKYFESA